MTSSLVGSEMCIRDRDKAEGDKKKKKNKETQDKKKQQQSRHKQEERRQQEGTHEVRSTRKE
eukprot:9929646-Prorocentrum_lima.AAC.1